MAILSMFSFVTSCGSPKSNKFRGARKRNVVQLGNRKSFSRLRSNVSSKALLIVNMISRRRDQNQEHQPYQQREEDEGYGYYYSDVEEEEEEEEEDEDAVWKRTILMGERCRPIDFSGKILYDSHGNLLPDSPRKNPQ